MNARMLHHLTIAYLLAIVGLLWNPTMALTGEKALDTATITSGEVSSTLGRGEGQGCIPHMEIFNDTGGR